MIVHINLLQGPVRSLINSNGKNFFKVFHPKVGEVCTVAYLPNYTPKLMNHITIKDNGYYKTNNAKVLKDEQ